MKKLFCLLLSLCLLAGCGTAGQVPSVQAPIATAPMPDTNVIPRRESRYFLNALEPELYANICSVYQSAMAFESESGFHYPMDPEDLTRLIHLVHYECPELFQLDLSSSVSYTTVDGKVISMTLPYAMTQAEYETAMEQCQQAVSQLLAQCQGLSDAEKERLVYDYITANCTYSTETANAGSVYGCLVEKSAKCDGISLTMKWILEQLGLSCLIISGDPVDGGIGHAWNVVCIDGQYYDVDVTADVRRSGEDTAPMYAAYNTDRTWIRSLYTLDPVYTDIPGTDSMAQSYHALLGNYIAAGQTPALEQLFLEAYNNQGSFTLQFASQSEFDSFCSGLESSIEAIVQNKSLPGYRFQSITAEEYRCIRIFVAPY